MNNSTSHSETKSDVVLLCQHSLLQLRDKANSEGVSSLKYTYKKPLYNNCKNKGFSYK